MKVVVESIGKVGSRALIGGRELVFDQPRTVKGGEERGPSPLDVLVAAVAGCAHYFAAAFLHGRGLPTRELSVEAEADKESAPTPRIGRLALKVRVPEGLTEQQLVGIVRAIKRCPAYGTLVSSPAVELSVEIVRQPPTANWEPDEHATA